MIHNITTLTYPPGLYISQVSFLLAEQTTEVAKTCVCPHLMDGSTAVAVETDNFWMTTPALVRERTQKRELYNHFGMKFLQNLLLIVECCWIQMFSTLPALNMSCGSVDDFECGNGDCINYSLTCDGMAHCKDKSDEKQSYCGEFFIGLLVGEQWAVTGHHLYFIICR